MATMENSKLEYSSKAIKSILLTEKYGLTLGKLKKIYYETEGEEIPFEQFGYRTEIELLRSMKNAVILRTDETGVLRIFAQNSQQSQHIVDLVANQNKRCRPNTRNRVRRPRGILPAHLTNQTSRAPISSVKQSTIESRNPWPSSQNSRPWMAKYSNIYRRAIDGNSWDDSAIKHDSWMQQPKSNGITAKSFQELPSRIEKEEFAHTMILNERKTPEPQNRKVRFANESDEKIWAKDEIDFQDINEKIVNFDEKNSNDIRFNEYHVEFNKIADADPTHLAKNVEIPINISQTFSPYKFWFHTVDESSALDSMMERIRVFYMETPDDPINKIHLPETEITVGNICAALYRKEWHRARIIQVDEDIQVFFIDYGGTAIVLQKDLRYLAEEFVKYPAFARRGCLDRCRPSFGIWSIHIMYNFCKFTERFLFEDHIHATITNINQSERTAYMTLIDKTQSKEINVSEDLIIRNSAYPTQKSLAEFECRHAAELRPSFDMLENGDYPLADDIFTSYENDGFDFIAFDQESFDYDDIGYETIQ